MGAVRLPMTITVDVEHHAITSRLGANLKAANRENHCLKGLARSTRYVRLVQGNSFPSRPMSPAPMVMTRSFLRGMNAGTSCIGLLIAA